MRLPKFAHLEPETIQETCTMLARYKDEAKVIAGGTDLLVKMKNREIKPRYIIRLHNVPSLKYIEMEKSEGMKIGALTTLSAVESAPVVKQNFSILSQAIGQMASPQIRHLGTIAGNLCNALPSADTAPPLLALNATLTLAGTGGERKLPIDDFFLGPEKTVLQEGELLTEIQIPPLPEHSGGVYIKHTVRSALELAIVGVAAVVVPDVNSENIRGARIALGAVAPTPMRAKKAEAILKGTRFDNKRIVQAAQAAANEAQPISDIRGSAEYRREMVETLTERAIHQAWEMAKSHT